MTKKSYRRSRRGERQDTNARRRQARIDQLKSDAERVANQTKAGGVSVRCVLIPELLAAVISDPGIADDDEISQIMRCLWLHDFGCRDDRPEEPRVCCSCNKEMGMVGEVAPALAVSIRPFGKLREAWNNRSVVALGCRRCTRVGPQFVWDAVMEEMVQDWSAITVFHQNEL